MDSWKQACLRFMGSWIFFIAAANGFGQTSPADGPWAGQAQCQIAVQGSGYTHQETHIWTVNGGTPTRQGGMRVFGGTWSVSGQGSLTRTQGAQTLSAQWITKASANAPVAVFVRASDGKLILKAWHAQLRQAGGVSGTQQVTINGVVQRPVAAMSLEAFEWSFPAVDGVSTSRTLSGSKSSPTTGSVGPMQPGGSKGTAVCTWNFAR